MNKSQILTQKDNILYNSMILFYEQGYQNTYFDQIADVCKITKPLISYHFKSKAALAKEVTIKYVSDNKNIISFKIYKYFFNLKKYDLQISTAAEIRLTQMQQLLDEKVFRYERERADDKYEELFFENEASFFKIHKRRYKLDINDSIDEITMMARAASAMSFSLRFAYSEGKFNTSLEDFLDYSTAIHFRLMNIDEEKIKYIIGESKKVIDILDFKFLPYFEIQ